MVQMNDIEKSFPGVKALDKCQFTLNKGEVHALVGENGAGKSTLMKVLTGVHQEDAGTIFFKGKKVKINSPRKAQELGISIIYQELNLMPHLTVAENVYIGREEKKNKLFIDKKKLNQKTKDFLKMLNINLDPQAKVKDLTVAKQQMVEIIKALSYQAEVLIMDEPTASLTDSEIEDLFRIVKKLRSEGVGVIYISHRLEELKEISDRITVMRNGNYIDTVATKDVEIDSIINMMVGREVYETSNNKSSKNENEVILEVKNLTRKGVFKNINFNLKKGEILGMSGLVGAGRTEVARAIFGADNIDAGEIYVHGKKVNISSPSQSVELGIGYLSEDRKRYGLALGRDVATNIVLANLKEYMNKFGFIKEDKIKQVAQNQVKQLAIKTPNLKQDVKNLSGGNQQKVVIGKWLDKDSEILIFDEPTRGIDVGAKNEIYKLLNSLVEEGKSVIMISSELPEILRMSHRILVMCEGEVTGELGIEEASKEKIMKFATMRN
ncbi:monosaccharide ABC transporter ATP-binding protein, CUT2 family (TC 3.A.1.2.-) [Halanaerobium salsuginis]|uniref:Monosaccharide ABC transporter ATP-binding protein, CUT2 family (TC 3.A.1.2.-) n=1 Tax=Halanaerobium salsuginis TaxID=29563 RepID=A0A1I4JIU5_9FIRM|nr:monosaccharide ABC transporter ATP-binding protein, CUT2 family (TC 3.A.1.2.-) [Halanaerobium salsuginis]